MGLVQGVPQRILVGNLNQIGCSRFAEFYYLYTRLLADCRRQSRLAVVLWKLYWFSNRQFDNIVCTIQATATQSRRQQKTRRDNQAVNEKMTASAQNIELRTGETWLQGKIRLCK